MKRIKIIRRKSRTLWVHLDGNPGFESNLTEANEFYRTPGARVEFLDKSEKMPEEIFLLGILKENELRNGVKEKDFLNSIIKRGSFSSFIRGVENNAQR